MSVAVLIAVWLMCWLLNVGMILAQTRQESPLLWPKVRRSDMGYATVISVFGPIATLVIFCITGFAEHGWRWRA
jgi:hypothetical protein